MSSRCPEWLRWIAVFALLALASACEREAKDFEPPPPGGKVGAFVGQPGSARGGEPADPAAVISHYEKNAYALAAGKRLFGWYNCTGCHANGGGSSGPALMDDVWIYGGDAQSIYDTIAHGRPNGMPAFGDRIPQDQIWQLAAYVRSLSGLAPLDAAPNRDDAFLTRTPESFADPQKADRARPSGTVPR